MKAAWGRKVFFLYPHSVFTDELFLEILTQEYEVYVLKSHEAAWKITESFPGSILFINIDDVLSEKDWLDWVAKLTKDPVRGQTRVGILTYNQNQELARRYLMDMSVSCGFIQLKQGLVESTRIILKTLEANEARGRRRYVRARCIDPQKATFNIRHMGKIHAGVILDISAAGMSYRLDKPFPIKEKAALDDIQLKLKGVLCRVSGIHAGITQDGAARNLLMFKQPVPGDTREKIHRFIYHSLREEMEAAIKMPLTVHGR